MFAGLEAGNSPLKITLLSRQSHTHKQCKNQDNNRFYIIHHDPSIFFPTYHYLYKADAKVLKNSQNAKNI
jgi:hypothetical protein